MSSLASTRIKTNGKCCETEVNTAPCPMTPKCLSHPENGSDFHWPYARIMSFEAAAPMSLRGSSPLKTFGGVSQESATQKSSASGKSSIGGIDAFAANWFWSKKRHQDGRYGVTVLKMPKQFSSLKKIDQASLKFKSGYSQKSGTASANIYISTKKSVRAKDSRHNKGKFWYADRLGGGEHRVGKFTTRWGSKKVFSKNITSWIQKNRSRNYYVIFENRAKADIGVSGIHIQFSGQKPTAPPKAPPVVLVPKVAGTQESAAIQKINKAGLKAVVKWRPKTGDKSLHGIVQKQFQEPGRKMQPGSEVLIGVWLYQKDLDPEWIKKKKQKKHQDAMAKEKRPPGSVREKEGCRGEARNGRSAERENCRSGKMLGCSLRIWVVGPRVKVESILIYATSNSRN